MGPTASALFCDIGAVSLARDSPVGFAKSDGFVAPGESALERHIVDLLMRCGTNVLVYKEYLEERQRLKSLH